MFKAAIEQTKKTIYMIKSRGSDPDLVFEMRSDPGPVFIRGSDQNPCFFFRRSDLDPDMVLCIMLVSTLCVRMN